MLQLLDRLPYSLMRRVVVFVTAVPYTTLQTQPQVSDVNSPVGCSALDLGPNYTIHMNTSEVVSHGDAIIVECAPGYSATSGPNEESVECLSGAWQSTLACIQEYPCIAPTVQSCMFEVNGGVSAVSPGASCYIRCKSPFTGDPTKILCPERNRDPNLTLSSWFAPACSLTDCPDPALAPGYIRFPAGWKCADSYKGIAKKQCRITSAADCTFESVLDGCHKDPLLANYHYWYRLVHVNNGQGITTGWRDVDPVEVQEKGCEALLRQHHAAVLVKRMHHEGYCYATASCHMEKAKRKELMTAKRFAEEWLRGENCHSVSWSSQGTTSCSC